MDLRNLGFEKGWLCECIVTTYHADGSPNAAPMGVEAVDERRLVLRVHRDTDTYENLLRSRCCVVNVTADPELFLRCALFGRHRGSEELETESVGRAEHVDAPYLLRALAYVECRVGELRGFERSDRLGRAVMAEVQLQPVSVAVLSPFPLAVNRGVFAAVELAIELSRGEGQNAERWLEVIRKTVPGDVALRIEGIVRSSLGATL